VGGEGQPCVANGTCVSGLACVDGQCVSLDASDGDEDANGKTDGDADGDADGDTDNNTDSDTGGVHLWSRRFGSTGWDTGYSVAVDSGGNVLVTGSFLGTVNFGGDDLTSNGDDDIFLAKYDTYGNHIWSKHFGAADGDGGTSVSIDGSGNVLMTGSFRGTVNFGGNDLTSAGWNNIFLAKFDGDGHHIWSKHFGANHIGETGNSVSVDGDRNVLVTGKFLGTVNFGGDDLTSEGDEDIFLAKYDSDGNHLWSKRFGADGYDNGQSVSVDGNGNVLVTGYFNGRVSFGGPYFTSFGNHSDIFLAKFDDGGNHIWSKQFGSGSYDEGYSVSVDQDGNVFATGIFQQIVSFGGEDLISEGDLDIFLAKFSSNGSHIWSKRFGSYDEDIGTSVSVDRSGDILVTGQFHDTVNFGGDDLTSADNYDIFMMKCGR